MPPEERLARLEAENRKLREINTVLMDRVEQDLGLQGGNAFSIFQAAIVLEGKVAERTAELTRLTRQLRSEISERRAAEAAREQALAEAERANLGKTRFLAAASHDLLQPLNAARLFLGALGARADLEASRLIRRIEASLDTVDELLGTLLDMSKLDSGAWPVRRGDVALEALLGRLEAEFRPQAAAAGLGFRVLPCRAVLHSDRHLLERLLRNLIGNAIRYTARGRVLVGARRRRGRLALEVWDTGPGIPAADRQRIFEEFARLDRAPRSEDKGLGLGLAIVDRIAGLLELEIAVDSREGSGSCFRVTLPAGSERPPEDAAEPDLAAGALDRLSIALIDDDADGRDALALLLESWGCRVAAGITAEAALARLDGRRRPDLVIADYHLGPDLLGPAVIAAVRAQYDHAIPALVVSADRSPALRSEIRELGLAFLEKPTSPAKLRAMLRFLVGPRGP